MNLLGTEGVYSKINNIFNCEHVFLLLIWKKTLKKLSFVWTEGIEGNVLTPPLIT